MAELGWTQEEIYLLADRGYAFYRQGRYREAHVIFEGLTAIDPSNLYCRTALAAVCMALGDAQRAVKELSFVLSETPAAHDARARRCEAYCEMGNWPEARQDLAILQRNGERHHVQRLTWRLQTGDPQSSTYTLRSRS
jgi:tetratricopeptide (TPR) repeat protein